ncbi:MAG: RNA polymerase sigma factor [Solirubrobacteraceae bacterium]
MSARSTIGGSAADSVAQRTRRRDGELVRRCRAGDQHAWEALVDRFSSYVYAILIRGFRMSQPLAEDVFQDVFLTVFRRLGTLADEEAIKPWIAQLTRRAAIDRLGAARPEVGLEAVPEAGAADGELALIEEATSVHEALAELPGPYRDVVERFFVRDQSYRTIAAELGLAPGTIASRISRGLAMLRRTLDEGAS